MKKILILLFMFVPVFSLSAQEPIVKDLDPFNSFYVSGEVVNIVQDENGFNTYKTRLKDGTIIDLDTYGEDVSVGASVYIEYFPNDDSYNFTTVNRNTGLVLLLVIFIGSILILARKKGLRSLGSLFLSILLLFFGLVPMLLSGIDPIVTTVIFGLGVLFLSIFVTHGFNYQSLVSFLGSFLSILLALVLIIFVSEFSSLTGLISDEIQFLSFETEKVLNLSRIVSASIIIGVLGVLDDITVTQVAVVRELSSDSTLSRNNIFTKALRVGRDHISSLVNTLIFAYVGATLPMIMFVTLLEIPLYVLLSQEFIFIEVIRSLIGAIALTMAVPVTTWLATHVFLKRIHSDQCSIESACAHHNHH